MNTIVALAIFAAVLAILTALYFLFVALLRNERRKVLIQKVKLNSLQQQAIQEPLNQTVPLEEVPVPFVNAESVAHPTMPMNVEAAHPQVPAMPINPETAAMAAPIVPPAPLAADGNPIYEQASELIERSPILDVPNPIVQELPPQAVPLDVFIPEVAASVAAEGKSSFGVRYSDNSANRVLRDKRRSRNAS